MKKGIFVLITGLPGAGKTVVGKELEKLMKAKFIPTLQFNGEDLRKYFNLKGWSKEDRAEISIKYTRIAKFLSDSKINLILSCVCLFNKFQNNNRKEIQNYFEVVLRSKFSKLKKIRKKLYTRKQKAWKVDLVPEFPKKPDLVMYNDYKKTPQEMAKRIFKKIVKKYEKNNS